MKKIVILISGRGSNLESILQNQRLKGWPAQVVQVISNRPDALGIEVAKKFGVPVTVFDHSLFENRELFDEAILQKTMSFEPDLVVLAGFMRILSKDFVAAFQGKLINIHPSLLPSFPGLKTHSRAIQTGVKWHGATVHFVTEDLDVGPIIIQGIVPVLPSDSESNLAKRVFQVEHIIYPKAIEWFILGRIALDQGSVRVEPSEEQSYILPMHP
jgi:phosphoribosylglycinamide formyltransferase-1